MLRVTQPSQTALGPVVVLHGQAYNPDDIRPVQLTMTPQSATFGRIAQSPQQDYEAQPQQTYDQQQTQSGVIYRNLNTYANNTQHQLDLALQRQLARPLGLDKTYTADDFKSLQHVDTTPPHQSGSTAPLDMSKKKPATSPFSFLKHLL